jgi:hypothetical protein
MDSGGETLRELDFQPEGVGLDRIEGGPIVAIALATVTVGMAYRLPLALVAVEELP